MMCLFCICTVPEPYQGCTCSVHSSVKGTSTRRKYGAGTALIRHRCFWRYLKPGVYIPYTFLQPGDVFIKGGSPGHAVIVVDVAIYPQTGKKVFLLTQSYMPAQQSQIVVNPANRGLSPWYELSDNDEGKLYTPEWVFEKKDLKRFK